MKCRKCHNEVIISASMPYCSTCIRENFDALCLEFEKIHSQIRKEYGLPACIPEDKSGKACKICVNQCQMPEGAFGVCGLRKNVAGKIRGPDKTLAYLDWYHDPLPTNCVADWVCAGSNDFGFNNLAVFYEGCTFNCLFCQNWHYRQRKNRSTTQDLVMAADSLTGCVCFFGGDPTPFAFHSIAVAEELMARRERGVRLCWETNGSVSPRIMKQWIKYALISNGCIKIDLKTFSQGLNRALCGSSNKNTKENIELVAQSVKKRKNPPLLVVSTLLIPGYLDEYEIKKMAEFLSAIDREIPWSLLGFSPHFHFQDMPCTSKKQAQMALQIAHDHGIKNTHLGNIDLLV